MTEIKRLILPVLLTVGTACSPISTPPSSDNAQGKPEISTPINIQAVPTATLGPNLRLIATAEALRANRLKTSFTPEGLFTAERFQEINGNFFLAAFPPRNGANYFVTSGGVLLKIDDPKYFYIRFAAHGGLDNLPSIVELQNIDGSREDDIRLVPDQMRIDSLRHIGIFRFSRKDNLHSVRLGQGLDFEDNVVVEPGDQRFDYAFFAYPADFYNGDRAPFLEGNILEPGQLEQRDSESIVMHNVEMGFGGSGGSLIRINRRTGRMTDIGMIRAIRDVFRGNTLLEDGALASTQDVSSLLGAFPRP